MGSLWQQAKQGFPNIPLSRNTFQLLLRDPEAFPGQMGHIIPSVSSGSTVESPPSWTCPEDLQREVSRRLPNRRPKQPQLAPFNMKELRLDSELPLGVQASHSVCKAVQPPNRGKNLNVCQRNSFKKTFVISSSFFSCLSRSGQSRAGETDA